MTWPPTRPVRKRLFGAVFLLVWVAGMYLCWGWDTVTRQTETREAMVMGPVPPSDISSVKVELPVASIREFGFSEWLHVAVDLNLKGDPVIAGRSVNVSPRGLTVALIVSALSSLILYVVWRALVGGFTCAAGTCDGCGYDLRALSASRCPECGEGTS